MQRGVMAHSSSCSAITAPMSLITEPRVGKMPTTSLRRRISRFNRSWGLLDQICFQCSLGNPVNANRSAAASSRCWAASGESYRVEVVDDPAVLGPY